MRVAITTYNRHAMLARLVESLRAPDVDFYVYDDGSEPPVEIEGATVYHYEENGGKYGWHTRVADLFRDALEDGVERLLWLPDDVDPTAGYMADYVCEIMESLQEVDTQAVCLNPLKLSHHPLTQWVGYEPTLRRVWRSEGVNWRVYKTQWMDCAGLVDRRFIEAAVPVLELLKPTFQPDLGTGVGRALSREMHERGYTLYQVSETLFTHGDHPSRLTPEGRKDTLVT